MKPVTGEHDGTGNHPSLVISPLVCSSIFSMQSGIVILYFALSVLVSLPVSETGWKFTAWTVSMFFCPNRMMPPSSWSLIDLMTVGTRTTPTPCLRQESIAYGASQWFLGLVLGETPSKLM